MSKNKLAWLNNTALSLMAVGALNWLLVALAKFDLVETITTALKLPDVAQWLYILIGASGAWIGILALQGKVKVN